MEAISPKRLKRDDHGKGAFGSLTGMRRDQSELVLHSALLEFTLNNEQTRSRAPKLWDERFQATLLNTPFSSVIPDTTPACIMERCIRFCGHVRKLRPR